MYQQIVRINNTYRQVSHVSRTKSHYLKVSPLVLLLVGFVQYVEVVC